MKFIRFFLLFILFGSCSNKSEAVDTTGWEDGIYAVIDTAKGEITLALAYDRAPLPVVNFIGLAEGTIPNQDGESVPFYDGLTFHRVEPGFVIQGGDPSGDGTGGPGYRFPNQIHPELLHDAPGVLAMANSGPDTNGSQFYITLTETPHLDGGYTVFGRVINGMDVVEKIEPGDTINSVAVVRIGAEAEAFSATREDLDAEIEREYGNRLVEWEAEGVRRLALLDTYESDLVEFAAQQFPENPLIEGDDGMYYVVIEEGDPEGGSPQIGDSITIMYSGALYPDMTPFDMSQEPAVFELNEGLIAGWRKGVPLMKKGEQRLLFIPPDLGYGENGAPPVIPANSILVFFIELIDFSSPADGAAAE